MKRIAMVLLFSAGLLVLARISSIVPQAAHACTEDGGDSGDDGDDGDG
jgi:hypothetical protein